MFIPLPVATGSAVGAMFALLVSLIFFWWSERDKSPRLVEIDYDKLSERRRRKARERADARGFVYLGFGKHVIMKGVLCPMSLGKEVVCRVEDDKLRIYGIDNVVDFLKGGGDPKCNDLSLELNEMEGIQAWYEPFAGYAKLKFDLGTSEFADIGSSYAEFWPHHSSKERATDALVLIYERVLEQQKKML